MSTAWRIGIGAILMLVLVTGLIFMMSWFKFQTTLTGLIQNRLTVVGMTLANSLEGAVDLGIGLGEVRIADALLRRARSGDPDIDWIEIFDAGGWVLFSTQTGRLSGTVPADFLEAQEAADERTWSLETDDAFISGVTLTNSFGQRIGGLVLAYSKDGFDAQITQFTASLARNTVGVSLVFAVLVVTGIAVGFRDLSRFARTIRAELLSGGASGADAGRPAITDVTAPRACAACPSSAAAARWVSRSTKSARC